MTERDASSEDVVTTDSVTTRKRPAYRLWLIAFIGFWLLNAGWAFAAPYDGPPDEQQHVLRAAGIFQGEILPKTGNILDGPQSLHRWPPCFPQHVNIAASCATPPGGSEAITPTYVSEARFNPIYYIVTGWPLAFWPNYQGIVLSRLITGALIAALLAFALVAANRWTRHRALVAGMVVAVTPMIAHLGGAVNPNGVEIAAGVALFAALIAVVHEQRQGVNRAAVALAGVSASVLVTPRFSGLMWVAVILAVMLIPSSWTRIKELALSRWMQIWAGVVVLATIASAVWTVVANTAQVGSGNKGMTVNEILKGALFDMWPNVVNQMVGVMGWAETLQPRLIYVAWFMAVGVLLLGAFALGGRGDRWRILLLVVGTFAPLLGMELLLVNSIGWFNQGRYFLPGAVGLPLLAAHILAKRGFTAVQLRATTRMLAILLLPIHLVCLAYTMCRWQSGLQILNPFKGSWMPPYGPVIPLVLETVGVVVLFVVYWRASRIPTPAAVVGKVEHAPDRAASTVPEQEAAGEPDPALSGLPPASNARVR